METSPETVTPPGVVFFDDNGNGVFDPSSEYTPTGRAARVTATGPLQVLFSVELATALDTRGLLTGSFASLATTIDFWQFRDAGFGSDGHWVQAVLTRPNLATMVIASQIDHGQPMLSDHPLAKMQLDGWWQAHAFFTRYNPDSSYTVAVGSIAAGDASSIPETQANQEISWDEVIAGLVPESTDRFIKDAAVSEMSDRVHAARFDDDLTATLWE